MTSIILFVLEDDREVLEHLCDIFKFAKLESGDASSTVWGAVSLADTEYRMECDPGIAVFTHFLFDLDVGYYKTQRKSKVFSYGEKTGFAGLDYILDAYENNSIFREKMEAGRVAVFTGHSIEFLRNTNAIELAVYRCLQSCCISKLDRDPCVQILKWLKGEAPQQVFSYALRQTEDGFISAE